MRHVSRDTEELPTVVVGLAADPGLPTEVAESMAINLPDRLARQVDDRVAWHVEVTSETLHLDESGRLILLSDERSRGDRGWDMMVGLTELPRRMGKRPLVLEVDTSSATAWVSVPALGGLRLRSQAEMAVIALIDRLSASPDDARSTQGRPAGPTATTSLAPLPDAAGESRVQGSSMRGWGSRLRLLLGMVRVNRPWRLVKSLDSVFAAAAATGAFGVFYASVWNMADTLTIPRLALINVVAIAILVWWLVFHNGLWERSSARGGRSTQPRLYNATTVLTLVVGVTCMYALLLGAAFLASMAVISQEYLEATLGHPVNAADYLRIAWFSSSMGTVAGALGSNFETEAAVRHVAYGRRQRERLG